MTLVIIIDILVVAGLVALTLTKGLERALPFFTFVVVFLPNESQIPLPGVFGLTTQRVALTTLTILFLFFKGGDDTPEPLLKKTPLRFLIAAHVIWCLISTANSVVPLTSVKQMLSQVIEYYLMYYILTRTISSVQTIRGILGAMVIAVSISCVFGTYEAYYSWNITKQWFPTAENRFNLGMDIGRGERVQSTFDNYSLFGSAISFAVVEAFYFLPSMKGLRKVLLWIAMLLMFWSIYKTVSRGPWLAVIIGFCMLFLFCQSRARTNLLVVAGLCVAVLLIRPGVWDTVKNLYLNTIDIDNPDNEYAASYQYRNELWHIGNEALARDPTRKLWGYGIESFYDLHLTGEFIGNPQYKFESCDNAWAQQMVETGYVGLFLIALLLVTPALLTLRNMWKIPRPHNYLCWVLFINMVQYYFMMTNLAIYSWGQTGYMLWMWIAMAMVYLPLVQRESVVRDRKESPTVEFLPQFVGAAQF